MLEELGHLQPLTPINIDNTYVVGIVDNTIKRQRLCSMEMCYLWLLDGVAQKYILFLHHLGQENLGDFQTKAFTSKDAQHARPF